MHAGFRGGVTIAVLLIVCGEWGGWGGAEVVGEMLPRAEITMPEPDEAMLQVCVYMCACVCARACTSVSVCVRV